MTETFNKLAAKGTCQNRKSAGFHFTVLGRMDCRLGDASILIMGPAVLQMQPQLQQQMAKYLKQGEEDGITASKMYEKLDSIDSPMAMVAQAQALPEQFIAPFTLGAPKRRRCITSDDCSRNERKEEHNALMENILFQQDQQQTNL